MPAPGSSLGRLAQLVGGRVSGDSGVVVTDAVHDSNQSVPGALFIALRGHAHDGHDFVTQAVQQGSPAVCVERNVSVDVARLLVPDTRRVMAAVAAEIQGHPSRQVSVVGVTGTNGKTTVTHLIESIVAGSGRPVGLIGTVETRIGGRRLINPRTTPEATDFQRFLRMCADEGGKVVAAEVSSHALALGRVDEVHFEVGAFTNLGRDHLDFHGDVDSYFAAKASLFERCSRSVIWVDDPFGRRLLDTAPQPLSVGWNAEIGADHVELNIDGSRFLLRSAWGDHPVRMALVGRFNVANALVAAGCALSLGLTVEDVAVGLEQASLVPGRFELVSGDDPVAVVVDYAHTPEGIVNAVANARSLTGGRVIVVAGAGGDRDREKRPLMGAAAASADMAIITSDNPRGEDPEAIIDEVMAGVTAGTVLRSTDRRTAIRSAIREAVPGDAVLILGKGHELTQEIGGRLTPFDDRQVARQELRRTRAVGGGRVAAPPPAEDAR